MAEPQKPVTDAPASTEPAATQPIETTTAPNTDAPVAESTPAETAKTDAPATDATAAPVTEESKPTETPTEQAAEKTTEAKPADAKKPVEPIYHGALGYKEPGSVKSMFRFSKRYFWFGEEEGFTLQNLSHYLRGEKPEFAHPNAAWASQTGKGLLLFVKHADAKSTPLGIINLSEVSDITKESALEFSFKLHGHKHIFQALNPAERDGWLLALEKTAEEAKAAREGIVQGAGYKENIGKLDKPATLAYGAAKAEGSATKKSTEIKPTEGATRGDSSSSDDNVEGSTKKLKIKSRSLSRGKRGSLFGSILGKKEEHEDKKDVKKEEKIDDKVEKKAEEIKETTEPKAEESKAVAADVPAGTTAPLDAHAVAERVLGAPAEDVKATDAKAGESVPAATATTESATETPKAAPKPTKRASLFGNFFEKVRSPGTEKKEHEVAPTVPQKDAEVTATPETSQPATTTAAPAEAAATPAAKVEETTTPKAEKENIFNKLLNKEKAKTPTAETPATAATETKETAAAKPETTEAAPAAAATTPEGTKEKRRTSFFGNLGGSVKKEKKADHPTNGDIAEEKHSSPIATIGNLFRNPSKGGRGNKEIKKEKEAVPEVPAVKAEGASEKPAPTPAEDSAAAEKPKETAPAGESAVVNEKPSAIGDVVPDAVSVGQPKQTTTPAVHAAA